MRGLGDWDIFVITKGCHRSKLAWHPFFRNTIKYKFILTDSAKYSILDDDRYDINKLIGFSDGSLNHHKNSFRIGWNYDSGKDEFILYAYTYVDGKRQYEVIGHTSSNIECEVSVTCIDGWYCIDFDGSIYYIKRSSNIGSNYKHMLWPYFGGNKKAPNTIKLFLKWRKCQVK